MVERTEPGSVVPFRAGQSWFCLHAALVVEVIAGSEPSPIAGPSPFLVGVIPWRGQGIAAVDVGQWRGAGPLVERPARWIVVRAGEAVFALSADSAREVTPRNAAEGEWLDVAALAAQVVAPSR